MYSILPSTIISFCFSVYLISPNVLPHSSAATPTNVSLHCFHSPSTVPFSVFSSSYVASLPSHYTLPSYMMLMMMMTMMLMIMMIIIITIIICIMKYSNKRVIGTHTYNGCGREWLLWPFTNLTRFRYSGRVQFGGVT